MAKNINLTIDGGTDFVINMPAITDSNGTVLNLSGYTFLAAMKSSYLSSFSTPFTVAVISSSAGTISLSLSIGNTSSLLAGDYVYDVLAISSTNVTTRIFEGIVTITPYVSSSTPVSYSTPNSRISYIEYIKRKLGYPVIDLNLEQDQIEMVVDDALKYFREYHYDATERTYLQHVLTHTDITNRYIPCDTSIVTVVKCLYKTIENFSLFSFQYQFRLQDFYNFSNVSMQNYVINQQRLSLLDFLLDVDPVVNFTRHTNRIYCNLDWNSLAVGDAIIFEVYKAIDENTFPQVFNDKWFLKYGTALLKLQWGTNLKKYSGTQLVGGTVLNGKEIYDEAMEEIKLLEESVRNDYQMPARIMVG